MPERRRGIGERAWRGLTIAAGVSGLFAGAAGGCLTRFDLEEAATGLEAGGRLSKPLPVPASLVTPGPAGLTGAVFAEFDVDGGCPGSFEDLLRSSRGVRLLAAPGLDTGRGYSRLFPRQLHFDVALASLKVADLYLSDNVLRLSTETAFAPLQLDTSSGVRATFQDVQVAARFSQSEGSVQIHFPDSSSTTFDLTTLSSSANMSGEFVAHTSDERAGTLSVPKFTLPFILEDGVLADGVEASLDFTVSLEGSSSLGCPEGCAERGKCDSGATGDGNPACICECGYSGDACAVTAGFCSPFDGAGIVVPECATSGEPAAASPPGGADGSSEADIDASDGSEAEVDPCETRRVYDNFYTGKDCKKGELWDAETCSCSCGGDPNLKGFTGGFCDVCDRDEACEARYGPGWECDQSLAVTRTSAEKSFYCDVLDREPLGLRGDMHSHCNIIEGVCTLRIGSQKLSWYEENRRDPTWYADLAHWVCMGTECTFSEGDPSYECERVRCQCTQDLGCPTYFFPAVESMFNSAEGPMRMDCRSSPDYCKLIIDGIAVQPEGPCTVGSCTFGNETNVNFVTWDSDRGLSEMAVGALVIVGLLTFLFLLLVISSNLKRRRMATILRQHGKLGKEDAELNALLPGNKLKFVGVTCTVPRKSAETGADSLAKANLALKAKAKAHACPVDEENMLPTSRGSAEGAEKAILSSVGGVLSKGEVMGIMGPSGSGKSTLINALAGATPAGIKAKGDILVDGRARGNWFWRIAAHVPQDTTLIQTLTVRECVLYSALLRLPWHWPQELKGERVEQVLKELNLTLVARVRVGSVSGGERRRVSIGMELVTSPNILFLDEPTSGLDSHTASQIMRTLTELARKGRMVCVSIHQPSFAIFRQLDKLLLLSGGSRVYFGPPEEVNSFFTSCGFPCPEHTNIADHILDVVSNDSSREEMQRHGLSQGPADDASTSRLEARLSARADMHGLGGEMEEMIAADVFQPMDWELSVLFRRTFTDMVRHPALLKLHIFVSCLLSIITAVIFANVPDNVAGVQNRAGFLFFTLTFFGFSSVTSIDLFMTERAVFAREQRGRYHRVCTYFLSKALADGLLLRILPAICFGLISYWIIGLRAGGEKAGIFFLVLCLFNLAAGALSMVAAVCAPSAGAAGLVTIVVLLISLLFGGFLANINTLPLWLGWLRFLSIFYYAYEVLMVNEIRGLDVDFDAANLEGINVKGDVFLDVFEFSHKNALRDIYALFGVYAGLLALALSALWALRAPRRARALS